MCIGSYIEGSDLEVWQIAIIVVGGAIIVVVLPLIVCVIVVIIKCKSGMYATAHTRGSGQL